MPSFTPDSQLELLFAPDIIPKDVKEQLGPDLHVRLQVHRTCEGSQLTSHRCGRFPRRITPVPISQCSQS